MHLGRMDQLAEDQLHQFAQPGRNPCAGGNRMRIVALAGPFAEATSMTAGGAPQAQQGYLMAESNHKAGSSTSMPRPAG